MIPVEIELDKTRQIKLTFLAMRKAEQKRGMGWMAMLSPENNGADTLLTLLWAGLQKDDPTLTIEKLGVILETVADRDPDIGRTIDKAIATAIETQGWIKLQEGDIKNPE